MRCFQDFVPNLIEKLIFVIFNKKFVTFLFYFLYHKWCNIPFTRASHSLSLFLLAYWARVYSFEAPLWTTSEHRVCPQQTATNLLLSQDLRCVCWQFAVNRQRVRCATVLLLTDHLAVFGNSKLRFAYPWRPKSFFVITTMYLPFKLVVWLNLCQFCVI